MPSLTLKSVLAAGACVVVVSMSSGADESKEQLEQAYRAGSLSLQEFVAKKDSLISHLNERYQIVKPILQQSCFDCHSQYTEYPWYHKVPIVSGMIDDDVAEGREHLDLSNDFPFSGRSDLSKLLREIKDEIERDKMPPGSYRFMHWGTSIEGPERDSLFGWIDSTIADLDRFFEQLAPPENSLQQP